MINPKLLLVTVDCCRCVIQCIDYQSNVDGFLLFVADSIDHQSNVVSGYLLLILLNIVGFTDDQANVLACWLFVRLMINSMLVLVGVERCWL